MQNDRGTPRVFEEDTEDTSDIVNLQEDQWSGLGWRDYRMQPLYFEDTPWIQHNEWFATTSWWFYPFDVA